MEVLPTSMALMNNGNDTTLATSTAEPLTEDLLGAKTVVHSIILVMSLFGNSLVILAVGMFPHMRSIPNLFLAHLAICDILTPLSNIPFDLVYQHNSYVWDYGKFMCSILWPFSTLFTNCSVLTLIAISIDRYRVLTNPMDPSKRLTARKCKIVFAVIYIIGILGVIPYSVVLTVANNDCIEVWNIPLVWQKVYTVFLFLLQYGLPLPTLIVVYIRLGLYLYRQEAAARRISETKLESGKRRQDKKWKRMRIFLAVVIVFATFMLPNQILWLWIDFGGRELKTFQKEIFLFNTFTYANSVCNPWIYAVLSRQFSDAFLRIFRRCGMKKKPIRKNSTMRSSFGVISCSSESQKYNRSLNETKWPWGRCFTVTRACCSKRADGKDSSRDQRNDKLSDNSHAILFNNGELTSYENLKAMNTINYDLNYISSDVLESRREEAEYQISPVSTSMKELTRHSLNHDRNKSEDTIKENKGKLAPQCLRDKSNCQDEIYLDEKLSVTFGKHTCRNSSCGNFMDIRMDSDKSMQDANQSNVYSSHVCGDCASFRDEMTNKKSN